MPITVTLPKMGESVVEGTVEKWLVREGDLVEKDQLLCEVSTDKVDAEIPAPESGRVARILVEEGTTLEVGAELVVIDPAAAGAAARAARPAQPAEEAERPEPAERAPPSEEAEESEPAAPDATRATPLARSIATREGVGLQGVRGSGAGGRVLKSDVIDHLARGRAGGEGEPGQPARPGTLGELLGRLRVPTYRPREGDRVIPFTAIRRRIAEHMVVSKIVSPHVGTVAEVDLSAVVRLREAGKEEFRAARGFSLSYLPFVLQAAVRGLKEFPRLNATVVEESIVERAGIHIGVAVETERGLVVPVVRNAADLSLGGLAQAVEDLARRARDRELSADDLAGGTFTVTNPGRQGNLYGFAVINQPQVGILRMGEVVKRPVVVERDGEDTLAIRPMMYLALSYDHRVIDGVIGNGFLYHVARELEAGDFEL